jgi:hypothetical protein
VRQELVSLGDEFVDAARMPDLHLATSGGYQTGVFFWRMQGLAQALLLG